MPTVGIIGFGAKVAGRANGSAGEEVAAGLEGPESKEEYVDRMIKKKAQHLFLNASFEDSYFQDNYEPQGSMVRVDIPHAIPLSNKNNNNTVHYMRQRLRMNRLDNS